MGYLGFLGLVLTGAGTMASILGIFLWHLCQTEWKKYKGIHWKDASGYSELY